MLSPNQIILSRILTHQALNQARRVKQPAPQVRVMEALAEAIASKRAEVESLVLAGKLDSEAYRLVKAQLASWSQAWASNR